VWRASDSGPGSRTARIRGIVTFKEKTPGDPNDPIAFEPPGRVEAAQLLGITW
jgi:hypothetical protein